MPHEDNSLAFAERRGGRWKDKPARGYARPPTPKFACTHDDGDNPPRRTQKVEPFQDDFNDGNLTGWSTIQTWSAASGAARNTVNGSAHSYIYKATTDANNEIRFDYINHDTSNNAYGLTVIPRINGNDHQLFVNFLPDRMQVLERLSGSWATLVNDTSVTTTEDVVYTVRVVAAGTNLKVYRSEAGGLEEQLCSVTVTGTTVTNVYLQARISSDISFDNVRILADDLASTWTMTSNDANELTQMQNSAQGSTYTYTYDAMGRTTEKALGGKTADYTWRYDSKLHTVTSDHFDEGNVTYDYGADGKRRSRTANSVTTGYNWAGWNVINEETGAGALAMTYVHNPQRGGRAILAQIAGNNPATGTAHYHAYDHLGSTRSVFTAAKALAASYAYTPYGGAYSTHSDLTTHRYTGHTCDSIPQAYLAPFRVMLPNIGRWHSRDPLGRVDSPNFYRYGRSNPLRWLDPTGLKCTTSFEFSLRIEELNPTCFLHGLSSSGNFDYEQTIVADYTITYRTKYTQRSTIKIRCCPDDNCVEKCNEYKFEGSRTWWEVFELFTSINTTPVGRSETGGHLYRFSDPCNGINYELEMLEL